VFTAVADVAMGYLVTHGDLQRPAYAALLIATSCLLYWAGMVLNDVFDAADDARERPQRPIPSGRVPLATAKALGWALLGSGLLVGWLTSYLTDDWRPGGVATLLALAVVLYDAVLKRTILGPLAMGASRLLNVLLGMSLAVDHATQQPRIWASAEWVIAAGIGTYIVGVTWFARTESRASSRVRLALATVVLLSGMGLLASLPAWMGDERLLVEVQGWCVLWGLLALVVARRCVAAIIQPVPMKVQVAVRNCLHSLIILDATVCVAFAGVLWGCTLALLIVPAVLLARRFDVT
jgi:4-hydroxybenzoate polyprenyltransferase